MKRGPSEWTRKPTLRRKRKRFRILRLLIITLKFMLLSLWSRVWRNLKRGASPTSIRAASRKGNEMPKVKIEQSVPPMPTESGDPVTSTGMDSPSSPSTGSENLDAVSEELAGDIIALPFEAWHLFNDAAEPLTESEKARLAGPFARIMEKYGMGKIAKDEVLLGFYLTAIIYGRVKATAEAKRQKKLIDGTREGSARRVVEH